MKKSVIYALCGLSCFSSIITANASNCSNQEQIELKKISSNIGTTYQESQKELDPSTYATGPEYGYGPIYLDYFQVIFSNITKDIYIKISNDYNDDIKFIRYQDTKEGIYTFDWENTDKITKFKYEVYSSTETSCPDEKYYTGYVVLPKFNEFSNTVMCEGVNDLEACQKYITSNMDPVEQERQINEYLKVKEEKEKKENKKWYEKIGDLVKAHKLITITGSIIVITGVATVVVKNKRKRVK